jgi:serine/threonine protein kinase
MVSGVTCTACQSEVAETAKFCANCGAACSTAPTSLVLGDYEVLDLIGQGGMGRVYRATQRRLNRVVCIKTLLPQFASDPELSRRFEQEATTTAALSHPNIVSVFDVGRATDGTAYMVMELIDGRTLRTVLRDESPLPLARAVKLVDQVLAALGEAHTHGIVHRDLKPGNVLVVTLRDGAELCKVLDFGIARVMDQAQNEGRLTRTGMLLGTPGYMAPEQIEGGDQDHRADLYAAGVLLYELVTGQRVYRAPNETELMKKTLLEAPTPPSARVSHQVPAALDAACLKALARDPRQRFASASEFREALAQVVREQPNEPGIVLEARTEYTALAGSMPSSPSLTNTRTLVGAVLAATDDWERARLLEPFERSLREAITAGEFGAVRAAMTALQHEQRDRGLSANLKALLDATRALMLDLLPTLAEWLADDQRRAAAQWLLRLLGRGAVEAYLKQLPELPPATQRELVAVVHTIDPDSSTVVALVRTLDEKVVKLLLLAARSWPNDEAHPLFVSALQSSNAAVRQAALEALDERTAFRLGAAVRQRLHDPVLPVRSEALRWVFRLEDEGAVGDLAKLLERGSVLPPERRAVWRALSHLKSEAAVVVLLGVFDTARELEQVAELALLLVRTRSPRAVDQVRRSLTRSAAQPRVKRVLEEALREV